MMRWIVFFIFPCSFLVSLPYENPTLPNMLEEGFFFSPKNKLAVRCGYERDAVWNRGMKAVDKITGNFDQFQMVSDLGVLTLNLMQRFEIYGKAGVMRIDAENHPTATTIHNFVSKRQFSWGLGGRILVYNWDRFALGIDAKWQTAHPSFRILTTNGAQVNPIKGSKIDYSEWQVGLGCSYQIDLFYPYLGITYSQATGHFKNLPTALLGVSSKFTAESRKKFGLALGCNFSTGSRFILGIEARVIDEEAGQIQGIIQF